MSELPQTMPAAILAELRSPLIVAEVELPPVLAVGQVLVEIHYSGVCGSQLGEIDGVKGVDRFLPHLLGHEGAGKVLAVGPGVRHVRPKQSVVLHWRKGAGIESEPPVYRWQGKPLNAGWVTTFNRYAIVAENRVTPIPDESDLKVAALFGCAVTTGFGVVENNARLRIGEAVVVFGAGGIGLNIVQAAALVSAFPIIAIDLYDNRLELARQLGATHTINSRQVEAKTAIQIILGGAGLDVFIDNTGLPAIIELGYELTKAQGRVILVGVPRQGTNIAVYSLPLHFGKQLTGSHGGEIQPQTDIPRYHNLYRAGKLPLQELLSGVYPLSQINTAIADMRSGKLSGRCLIQLQD